MLDYNKQTGEYMENRTTTLFHLMLHVWQHAIGAYLAKVVGCD
jgi:hypothetical protein